MNAYEFTGDLGVPEGGTAPVGGSEETVMNPTVPDMLQHSLTYEGTVQVNGSGTERKYYR